MSTKTAKPKTTATKAAKASPAKKAAACEDHGPGHRLAHCRIKTEITDLMTAAQRALMPGYGLPDRTGKAAALLTHRLSELAA